MKRYIEKLRPYVNVKYNKLCSNPDEINIELVSSLSWSEIYNICSFEGSESEFRKKMIKSGILGECNLGKKYYVLMNPEYCCKSIEATWCKYFFDFEEGDNWDSNIYNPNVYSELKNILLILESKYGGFNATSFESIDCLAQYLDVSPNLISEILNGVELGGEIYKYNIYYKMVDKNTYYSCLIVYKEDWINYSQKEKDDRINELTDGQWSIR